jgi:hypothetical protein
VTGYWWVAGLWVSLWLVPACNSDVPVAAVGVVTPPGMEITVTRVATHPFLARFDLKMTVRSAGGCLTASELFPDTGGVSRRNVYRGTADRLYVIGQFDVRRFDPHRCRIELMEFRSLEADLLFVGSFDIDGSGRWSFIPADAQPERPFQPL